MNKIIDLQRIKLNRGVLITLILVFALILRVWGIGSVPVSLFGDEVDIGYHAYSLLKTGRDYSGNFLPLHLKSLADYKPAFYAYSIIPTVAIFGVSPLGVRLPSAIFGVLGIYLFYLLVDLIFKNKQLALLSAFLLAISPWHIHFSRWGSESIEMLTLYLVGLYCFLRSFEKNKLLILSSIFFALTPLTYHSAKVFLPLTLIVLGFLYRKQIMKIQKKYLVYSIVIFFLIIIPITWSTFFAGGTDRFQSTSIFRDLEVEGKIGFDRVLDKKMGYGNTTKLFHNKITYFGTIIANNYLKSFSTEFLFIKGDPNPRHTISGQGLFYKFEAIFLVLGLIFLFIKPIDLKLKAFLIFWILAAPLPSILTDQGGEHAIRLLFLLPPLIILISLGVYYSYFIFSKQLKNVFVGILVIVLFLSFLFYQHQYWVHYPWDSERWWQAGFKEAIQSVVSEGQKYDKVIISGADEPPLIFFLGWSQYPPSQFQQTYPLVTENLENFGKVSKLDKYYFPPIGSGRGLYDLGSILPKNSLYLATIKEIKLDLIKEPDRVPNDLILIKSIPYSSGEPAFYLFTRNEKSKKS